MPTKPNKAGEQQNYVPSGNGDASGEYGDNATGSNKHFINFSKKDVKTVIAKSKKEEPIAIEQGNREPTHFKDGKNNAETINNMLKNKAFSTFTKKQLAYYLPIINNADDLCNKAIVNEINKGDITYKRGGGFFSAASKEVHISTNDGSSIYVDGGIFYHENGHMVDYNGQQDRKNTLSMTYVSKTYNKTLIDMLDEEYSNIENVKIEYKVKLKEIENKVNNTPIVKEYSMKKNEWENIRSKVENDPEIKEYTEKNRLEQAKMFLESLKDNSETQEFYREKIKNKQKELQDFINKKYPSYNVLKEQILSTSNPLYEARAKATESLGKTYSDMSDIYSMHEHISGGFGAGGHTSSYSIKRGKAGRATELFAEMFQAKAVNKKSAELFERTFPKTREIFNEILKEHK